MSNGQRAPQVSGCVNGVLADPRAYFFSLIDRTEGSPAPDWKAVLESLPGRGMGINPKPGEHQPLNAPHYGITVMIDAGKNARGRIWLPTDVPVMHDGNAWFTHEIQVIADGPTPGSMVWAWHRQGRSAVRPAAVPAGSGTSTGTGAGAGTGAARKEEHGDRPRAARGTNPGAREARLRAGAGDRRLEGAARRLHSAGGGALPKKIALKTDHGTYVTAEPDGRMTNREDHAEPRGRR